MPVPATLAKMKRAENVTACVVAMNEFEKLCLEKDENKLLACNEAYEAVLFNAVEKFYIGDDAREVSERDDTEIVRENKSLMQAALTAFASVSGKESWQLYFVPSCKSNDHFNN